MGDYLTVSELAKKYKITSNSIYSFIKKHRVNTKQEKVEKVIIKIDENDFVEKWKARRKKHITLQFVKDTHPPLTSGDKEVFITEGGNGRKNVYDYNVIQNEKALAYILFKSLGDNVVANIGKKELENVKYEKVVEELIKLGWIIEK